MNRDAAVREIARCFLAGAGMTIPGELARVTGLSRPEAGRGNVALVAEGYATMPRAASIGWPIPRSGSHYNPPATGTPFGALASGTRAGSSAADAVIELTTARVGQRGTPFNRGQGRTAR